MPNINFLSILGLLTIFAFVVIIVDLVLPGKRPLPPPGIKAKAFGLVVIEYARALFPVLLIVLFLRSFVAQPYRVPTGSLEPTIMPGDFILVSQYNYGLRLPLWDKEIIHTGDPKLGQIALFHWPVNPKMTFVKRVMGVPGDHVSFINNVFYINGKKIPQKFVGDAEMVKDDGSLVPVKKYQEIVGGITHYIYVNPKQGSQNFSNLVIPKGEYFMVGDNRNASDDSRYWGLVKQKDFIGQARRVFFSWDKEARKPRWDRMGDKL